MKRHPRRTNTTILLAVEGFTDEAFARHLKTIYIKREMMISVTVKNAKGKGPEGIQDAIKSAMRTADYSLVGAIFDGDIPISPKVGKWLTENHVQTFVSSPAIEATLLSIHGLKIGRTTDECKNLLATSLKGDSTEPAFYEKHFSRPVLESGRFTTSRLNDLIIFLTTPK